MILTSLILTIAGSCELELLLDAVGVSVAHLALKCSDWKFRFDFRGTGDCAFNAHNFTKVSSF